jgi:hypothetical protein
MIHFIILIILLVLGGYYALSSDGMIADRSGIQKPKTLPMTCGLILGIVIGILSWIV